MTVRKEYGDFQTPIPLAREVVALIAINIGTPQKIIEPTCGIGNFIDAAYEVWGDSATYLGFEINPAHCLDAAKKFLDKSRISIVEHDFFSSQWQKNIAHFTPTNGGFTLIIGNPPWVSNSTLGTLNSSNAPEKSNFQGLRGFEAKTGKANFDIAEWMIIRLVEALPTNGVLAMLCKTATARKVLKYFWQEKITVSNCKLYKIDAKKHFNVSVDACLLVLQKTTDVAEIASIYDSINDETPASKFGLEHGEVIANLDDYKKYKDLDGLSHYKWRSGVKHDASDVMELTPCDSGYSNGLNEIVAIESEYIFPLLKSSDLGNGRITPRRSVIIPQRTTGDDPKRLRVLAPLTYQYLEKHSGLLDFRKSSIYRKRPRFSIFGIGDYSFAEWKVAISGLYKTLRFSVVPPVDGKPTMLDDTCYFFPCPTEEEAFFWVKLLNSEVCIHFLHSLVFLDAKRPVTIEILNRIDLDKLARRQGQGLLASKYLRRAGTDEDSDQHMLVFDDPVAYNLVN